MKPAIGGSILEGGQCIINVGANWIRDLFSSFWEGLTNGGNGSVGFFGMDIRSN